MSKYLITLLVLISTSIPIICLDAKAGDVSEGEGHYATCQACHGANAEGNQTMGAPRLVDLQEWYLVKQMQKYRTGLRGSEAQDSFGQQMAAIAKVLHSLWKMRLSNR